MKIVNEFDLQGKYQAIITKLDRQLNYPNYMSMNTVERIQILRRNMYAINKLIKKFYSNPTKLTITKEVAFKLL